jgi:hypothetical protein
MPLNSRLQSLFSEYEFLNERHLSMAESLNVLSSYCNERGMNISSVPSRQMMDFCEVMQYAPAELPTGLIAERTGVVDSFVQDMASQIMATNQPSQSQPRRVQPTLTMRVPRAREGRGNLEIGRQMHEHYEPYYVSSSLMSAENRNVPVPEGYMAEYLGEPFPVTTEGRSERVEVRDTPEPELEPMYFYTSSPKLSATSRKKKRSEKDMMADIVRGENFPKPNFKDWANNREFEKVLNDWYTNVEYREHWIFSRREREGFNRRGISQFSLDDVMARISKRKKPHELDTKTSKFYDWKLGGTDWILRLELFQHEQHYFLIVRHIHTPSNVEIKFDVRYWYDNKFKPLNALWAEQKVRDDMFERVFGSSDSNNMYYVAPCDDDDFLMDFPHESDEYDDDCDGDGEADSDY